MVPRPGNAGWADSDEETRPCPQADSDAGTRSLPAGRLGKDQSDEPEGQVAGRKPEFFDLEITC